MIAIRFDVGEIFSLGPSGHHMRSFPPRFMLVLAPRVSAVHVCVTHAMVSIMSRPISTQQWAWSALGWVNPETQ